MDRTVHEPPAPPGAYVMAVGRRARVQVLSSDREMSCRDRPDFATPTIRVQRWNTASLMEHGVPDEASQ